MLYNTDEPSAVGQVADVKRTESRVNRGVKNRVSTGTRWAAKSFGYRSHAGQAGIAETGFCAFSGSMTFVQKNIEAISKGTTERGLPMFSAFRSAFRKGEILLALVSPLNGVGQIAAYQAGQILFHGRAPDSLPSPTLSRYSVLINMKPARALQIYPPMKLLQFAEVTR